MKKKENRRKKICNFVNEFCIIRFMLRYQKIFIFIFIFIFSSGLSIRTWGQEVNRDSLLITADQLSFTAKHHFEYGDDSIAIAKEKQSLNIKKKLLGDKHPQYILSLNNLASYYFEQGLYETSLSLITEALNKYNNQDSIYAESLMCYADICSLQGNFAKAIMLCNDASKIIKDNYKKNSKQYAKSLINLANIYYDHGNVIRSTRLCEEALTIFKNNGYQHNSDYANIVLLLAKCKTDLGESKEALYFGIEGASVLRKLYGNKHPSYATALNILGVIHAFMGDIDKAILIEKEALYIYEEKNGKMHLNYAVSLGNIAGYFFQKGDYETSIKLYKDALNILIKTVGKSHPYYALYLRDISEWELATGNYDAAIRLCKEALGIQIKVYGRNHTETIVSLRKLAEYYYNKGDEQKAIKYAERAEAIERKNHRMEHPYYACLLDELSYYYLGGDKNAKAFSCARLSMDLFIKYIKRNWGIMPKSLQERFWQSVSGRFFNYAGLAYRVSSHDISSDLYNRVALFAKGMLINKEIEMKNYLLESGDSSLIDCYNKLQEDAYLYNTMNIVSESDTDKDTMMLRILKQEENLSKMSKFFQKNKNELNTQWEDIRNNLKYEDVALEFLSFPLLHDSIMYVALTIRKESEKPKMTILFEEKQLKEVSDTLYYQCPEMYNLVWKPLQEELQGVKNIYFSPSGRLHNIGIEYLPEMEGYNIYRLSSTRELVTKESQETEKKAVLYGGLDYAAMIDSASVVISVAKIEEKFKERANVRGIGFRGGKEYLKHTKIEVDDIGRELNEAQWVCLLDTASLGTEESFKSLSGKRVGCLHISTHGFYYTQQAAVNTGYNFLLLNDKMASEEDKALTRTGLIMSGANHILDGDTIPDDVEDGILTAKEIADVDLRGLDLVVLSACQTGLGDISQGEGVFGLQRGFKKAGAKSILMSLWEVDDKATQILMTQFYKNLLSGQSKRQSLLSAQRYLCEYNGGTYNNPQYWAAFILLDAL